MTLELKLPDEEHLTDFVRDTASASWGLPLSRETVESWLSNFTGRVFDEQAERRLALWLLYNFVYYNETEMRHLLNVVYKRYIHHNITNDTGAALDNEIQTLLRTTAYLPVGSPSESGYLISYYFRQANRINADDFLFSAANAPKHVKYLVYLDDISISGQQAADFFSEERISWRNDQKAFYLTIIASEVAIQAIEHLGIEVVTSVLIDDRSRCFAADSNAFHYFPDDQKWAREFAYQYGLDLVPGAPLGFDDGEYAFGFHYNTPDNTLPIFWSHTRGWKPIFRRFLKGANVMITKSELGKYV